MPKERRINVKLHSDENSSTWETKRPGAQEWNPAVIALEQLRSSIEHAAPYSTPDDVRLASSLVTLLQTTLKRDKKIYVFKDLCAQFGNREPDGSLLPEIQRETRDIQNRYGLTKREKHLFFQEFLAENNAPQIYTPSLLFRSYEKGKPPSLYADIYHLLKMRIHNGPKGSITLDIDNPGTAYAPSISYPVRSISMHIPKNGTIQTDFFIDTSSDQSLAREYKNHGAIVHFVYEQLDQKIRWYIKNDRTFGDARTEAFIQNKHDTTSFSNELFDFVVNHYLRDALTDEQLEAFYDAIDRQQSGEMEAVAQFQTLLFTFFNEERDMAEFHPKEVRAMMPKIIALLEKMGCIIGESQVLNVPLMQHGLTWNHDLQKQMKKIWKKILGMHEEDTYGFIRDSLERHNYYILGSLQDSIILQALETARENYTQPVRTMLQSAN